MILLETTITWTYKNCLYVTYVCTTTYFTVTERNKSGLVGRIQSRRWAVRCAQFSSPVRLENIKLWKSNIFSGTKSAIPEYYYGSILRNSFNLPNCRMQQYFRSLVCRLFQALSNEEVILLKVIYFIKLPNNNKNNF